jgi:putative membrane protein
MKKSEFDFSIPNRQSYVAILLILFKTIAVIVRQILPVLFVILIGGSGKKGDYIIWAVIVIAFLSMIYSILNFFRTYFFIQNDELILHSGILQRKKTSIPFSKIQTINFEQNIIHQLFSVLKLKIDTAGSDKNEFEFHAIESEKAHALRTLILHEKKIMQIADQTDINLANTTSSHATYRQIMALSLTDLLKVGLTENHIRSGGLILLFVFWTYQNLQEVGVDVDEYSEQLPIWEPGLYFLIFFSFLIIIISIFISLVRTVINNFDLQFLRSQYGFKVVSGLFTKKEVSASDHKIQHISWSDNLLKRLVGFKDLRLNQASSTELNAKQNINIPGCNETHIKGVVATLFGDRDFSAFPMQGIDRRYFTRFATIVGLLSLLSTVLTAYYFSILNASIILLLSFYLILSRYISYTKKAYGYDDSVIYIKGGVFGDSAEILPMYKVQGVNIHESPYQTSNQLCSITLHTASGNIRIPYISRNEGSKLADLLIYKVEIDKRRWM